MEAEHGFGQIKGFAPPSRFRREGDSFTVNKLGRLARSIGDLLAIVSRLVNLRVPRMSGTQPLDTAE
jgi:hypothetical protein